MFEKAESKFTEGLNAARLPRSKLVAAGRSSAQTNLFHSGDDGTGFLHDIRRRCIDISDELFDIGAAHWVHVHFPLLGFGKEIRILEGVIESLAQGLLAILGNAWRGGEGPAHDLAAEDQLDDLLLLVGLREV